MSSWWDTVLIHFGRSLSAFQESAQFLAGSEVPEVILQSLFNKANLPEKAVIGLFNLTPYDTWLETVAHLWPKKQPGQVTPVISLSKSLPIVEYCQRSIALKLLEDDLVKQKFTLTKPTTPFYSNWNWHLSSCPTVSEMKYISFSPIQLVSPSPLPALCSCTPGFVVNFLERIGSVGTTSWGRTCQNMRRTPQRVMKLISASFLCKWSLWKLSRTKQAGADSNWPCPKASDLCTMMMRWLGKTGVSYLQILIAGLELDFKLCSRCFELGEFIISFDII